MRTLLDIDFLADEALRGRLAAWSAALLAGGAASIALLVALGALPGVTEADALLGGGVAAWFAALIIVSLAALPPTSSSTARCFASWEGRESA